MDYRNIYPGMRVLYRPYKACPEDQLETGVVVGNPPEYNGPKYEFTFVLYGQSSTAQATRARDLTPTCIISWYNAMESTIKEVQ